MVEEIRKTVRFTKEEFDYIMNDSDLKEGYGWQNVGESFSERLRKLISKYQWQKERIEGLVKQCKELSDKCARLSDNRYQQSDKGYPKETKQEGEESNG